MNEDNVLVYIVDSVESFDNEVERFIRKKKFKKLPNQITELVGELQRGEFSGIILNHNDELNYDVYKKRLPNSDVNSGKSNGYRVIYIATHNERVVVLLSIYYKKEIEKLSDEYIQGLIDGIFEEI